MDKKTIDFLMGRSNITAQGEDEERVPFDSIEIEEIGNDKYDKNDIKLEEVLLEDIDKEEEVWENIEDDYEEDDSDYFEELEWDIDDFEGLEEVEEIEFDIIEDEDIGALWGEDEEDIIDTFDIIDIEESIESIEDVGLEINITTSLTEGLDKLEETLNIELDKSEFVEVKKIQEEVQEIKEIQEEIEEIQEEIIDTVEDINIDIVEEEIEDKYRDCIYEKGMSIEDFLRKNPTKRTSEYIEHFFNNKEIEEALLKGSILVKKGVYKI